MDWIFNRVRAIEARRELTEFWAKENRPVSPYNYEYVITDRRYTKEEFAEKLRRYGFKVLHSRFVRAKHFGEALTETDKHAKEILFVVKKEYKLF